MQFTEHLPAHLSPNRPVGHCWHDLPKYPGAHALIYKDFLREQLLKALYPIHSVNILISIEKFYYREYLY